VRASFRPAKAGTVAPARMVWLPGAYHAAQDFLNAGFPEAVQLRRISLDLVFVDLELQHLADRSALQQLRSDIVLPTRNLGVSIWLGGVSLGGMFALSYAAAHPAELDGLCLLAPYLGNRLLTAEIAAASGPNLWEPGELADSDEERRIWRYIKTRRGGPQSLYLGFGRGDRFSAAHRLLAETLPAESVNIIEGGHEWRTWTTLWENFLDSRFA
jgi:pimeloyl-ACP methyl ester carboxylesterase